MAIAEMKKYMYDNSKIDFVLSELGCHNIKYHEKREYYSASFPDGDNPQGINVRNNIYLNYRSFSRNVSYDDCKDIIDLTMYIRKCEFREAVFFLHKLLGIEYKPMNKKKKEEKSDRRNPLEVFRRIRRRTLNVDEIHVLDDELLDEYVPLLHIDWFREGIMPWTAKKFSLAYSYRHSRVVVPMKHWMTGDLMGVNMRTTIENYKELGIMKYFITPTYQKNLNLFGLYENYKSIKEAGYCIVYEAEKSVLKRDSRNDPTGVALSGHTMSDEQVRILIGLNVEIIIAMDKDIPIEEVRNLCEKFYKIRHVSYIIDNDDLLGEKDSPADGHNKNVFQVLFDNRIRYDRGEHAKYLDSLKG